MAWAVRSGAAPKYRTAEHRNRRAALVRRMNAGEVLTCCEDVCQFTSRAITNTNGNAPDGLHLAHTADGQAYRGASHRKCNLYDAAVRANLRSRGVDATTRWVL